MKISRVSCYYFFMVFIILICPLTIQANRLPQANVAISFPTEDSNRLVEGISISINQDNNTLSLTWEQVTGIDSYKVYSSTKPQSEFEEDLSGVFSGNSWTGPLSNERRFYYVAAVANDNQTNFILVEGGTFNNGTSNITLSSFYISNYELKQAEYEAVIGENPSNNYDNGNNPNHPIEKISWYDALVYCNLRSVEENLTPCYSYAEYGYDPAAWPEGWNSTALYQVNFACDFQNNGYRLPTEMEWMFAAKGGNLSNNYTYSGSENINAVAWYNENSASSSHEVGLLAPNELGLYDMSGNVFELCWDLYGEYPTNDQTNPHGPSSGSHRCIRGGSWSNPFLNSRVFHRSILTPTSRNAIVGLRLVRSTLEEQVSMPTFSPPAGVYNDFQSVIISTTTPGATIRYTLDDTEPNESSAIYYGPIDVYSSLKIKAKAYKNDMIPSIVGQAEFHIQPESFILVEGATFNNGTADVTLSSFYLDKYEVTQSSYLEIMGTNPSYFTGNLNRPVEQVTWFDAIEYCNRRSIQENLNPYYRYDSYGVNPDNWPNDWDNHDSKQHYVYLNNYANGYRLPTEMEWMFAAMGGNQSSGYIYSGSNNIWDVAWFNANALFITGESDNPDYGTHSVGTKQANELGFYDMSGNVFEMCWDILGEYSEVQQTNPTGASTGDARVMRGGCWNCSENLCRIDYRTESTITNLFQHIGFRCARNSLDRQVQAPIFNLSSGTYLSPQSISITSSSFGSEIRYTTDGSEPSQSSLLYSSPIEINYSTILRARAYKDDLYPSLISEAEYFIVPDNFIQVEGGTFNNGFANVTLSPFLIDKYEITQVGYQAVMGNNPSYFADNGNKPVENVSWFDAIEYCNRRSIQENQLPCYSYGIYGSNPDNWPSDWNSDSNNTLNISCDWSVNGYRLPTEMEWMFAAKGGNQSLGYTYSGSNNVWDVAWFSGNASQISGGTSNPDYGTHEVGTKDGNELGIYDMSGNVWEWCWDHEGSLSNTNQINPTTDQTNPSKVIKGGGWQYGNDNCLINHRGFIANTTLHWGNGFRCVRGIHQEQVSTPSFSHPGGHGYDTFNVRIECETFGSVIRYTTDGSEPNSNSTLYTSGIFVTSNHTILKAKAFKPGLFDSETGVFEYWIFPPDFKYVEGGTFNNGSSQVTISSFYMDKYEMTQINYQNIMGTNPSHYPNYYSKPNRPVDSVNLVDAISYCNRRSISEGLTPCYTYQNYGSNPDDWAPFIQNYTFNEEYITCNFNANGYRLPTEMEWMFAAKGGNQSENYTYCGSNNLDEVGWYNDNATSHCSVGLKQANELGIYDMSGNVWEWCWDYYATYPSTPQVNPTGPVAGDQRMIRGGSFAESSYACTNIARASMNYATRAWNIGFRLVRSIP